LSIENASVDRIKSRINQTPIQEVKRRQSQHLEETYTQKNRLERIIKGLGGEPTNTKANLSRSDPVAMVREYFSKSAESEVEASGHENSISILEEDELVQMKNDFVIEHDEMVAYETLIRSLQMANMHQWQEFMYLLERSRKEEESMAYWYKIHTPLIFDNLWPKIIHSSISRGQKFLLNYSGSKIPFIILYADLVGSTSMSMTLPVDNLVTIIRAFTHQISHVIDGHGGYVLKYVGDAVISFFPDRIIKDKYSASGRSVECGKLMINVIKEEINTIFKRYGYPELFTKIGIDAGENAIVQYGSEQLSPIDMLGYSMNIAAKITSLTGANKISIGENVYKSLDPDIRSEFREIILPDNRWKYINYGTDKPYKVYTLKS
jgi:adenylate cyclase